MEPGQWQVIIYHLQFLLFLSLDPHGTWSMVSDYLSSSISFISLFRSIWNLVIDMRVFKRLIAVSLHIHIQDKSIDMSVDE